jgi:hypothetical protein
MTFDVDPLAFRSKVAVVGLGEAGVTMPLSTIYIFIAVALLLFGLAQSLGLIHRAATARRSSWLWLVASSLFWFAAGCGLLALVLRGQSEQVTPTNLSSPYPEIGFLILGVAVLWLGYEFYKLWRRHTL